MSQLTTAEAFGASLWLVGEHAAAEALLDPFPGGLNFFDVNRNRFDVYERTRSPEELLAAEATLGE
jgi:ribosome biogenesis protein Tsr3